MTIVIFGLIIIGTLGLFGMAAFIIIATVIAALDLIRR